ncbi:MAG TPA: hypothetical protein VLI69_00935, partial [Gammaproteobacteria bacterium]|nr:hypothetical protein [Gammaproteobacteria bacterium]
LMITKRTLQYYIIALSFFSISTMYGATTLQHFDPAPIFSANDSMMPPNSQFLDLKQARMKDETPSRRRWFGLNFSGFIQGANTAYGYAGCNQYGTACGVPENGFEMGDFRGTMYVMGLFLGKNPKNSHSIWRDGADEEDGIVTDITCDSVRAFFAGEKECLEDIVMVLSGNEPQCGPPCTSGGTPTCSSTGTALIFNNSANPLCCPSIFQAAALARDTIYFGAFSMPIEYKKQGFRWELNFEFGNYVGLTIQSGIVNMKQKFTTAYTNQTFTGQTNFGPYSISGVTAINATCTTTPPCPPLSSLYNSLNTAGNATFPNTAAQALFDSQISNNLDNILNPTCGHNQGICSFDQYSVEDIRFFFTVKYPYDRNAYTKAIDGDRWPDMIFTPYAYLAGSIPTAKKINYRNLLSLPFGNNGHGSFSAAGGMTFDFVESIEVGVEGGITVFIPRTEFRPFPTHKLQRVLYPFSTNVRTTPGLNGHFKAMMNAYQFLPHVSFWFVYELIEHRQDCFKVCDEAIAQYFVPSILECKSDWRAQMFNAALVFDIQPGMQLSFAWQQSITPRNAYYPVALIGSINFLF